MKKIRYFRVLALSGLLALGAGLAAGCSSCGEHPQAPSARPSAPPAPASELPEPPFQGAAPVGAMVVGTADVGHYGGTLVLTLPGNPRNLNPILLPDATAAEILGNTVFSTCWAYNNGAQASEPGLCEKFDRAPDGMTYTFTLREGLRWSDGVPITVDDLAFSYNVALDPAIPNTVKDLFKQGKDATGKDQFAVMEKVDDRVFRMKLKEPNATFEGTVGTLRIIPRHRWEAVYEAGNFMKAMGLQTPPEEIVSSGPFRIKSFVTDERVVLERNPYFWKVDKAGNRLPYLNRVVFMIVPDFNVALLKFREGETDAYEARAEDVELLTRDQGKGDYTLYDLGPAMNTNYLMFNLDPGTTKEGKPHVDPVKLKWFLDKRFRQAISHAIDRDSIVRVVYQGRGEPLWTFTSPGNNRWYNPNVPKYPYSLDKARALLTAVGFTTRDGGLYDADGHRVSFTVLTNSENSSRIAILNLLKEDFTQLGMEVAVRPMPMTDLVTALNDTRAFEAVLSGWGTGVPPDPLQMKNILLSSGRSHHWHPNQPEPATPWEKEMDRLIAENGATTDMAARKRAYDELENLFAEELPQIGLAIIRDNAVGRRNLGNFHPSALRPRLHWNADSLFLKHPKTR